MASDLGFGSSVKYGCASTWLAPGRCAGSRASREISSELPAVVRKGNLARRTEPVVWAVRGRRRDLALGRERKVG